MPTDFARIVLRVFEEYDVTDFASLSTTKVFDLAKALRAALVRNSASDKELAEFLAGLADTVFRDSRLAGAQRDAVMHAFCDGFEFDLTMEASPDRNTAGYRVTPRTKH
jgi:hypothetical protein